MMTRVIQLTVVPDTIDQLLVPTDTSTLLEELSEELTVLGFPVSGTPVWQFNRQRYTAALPVSTSAEALPRQVDQQLTDVVEAEFGSGVAATIALKTAPAAHHGTVIPFAA